jgi:DEAD/DEAH box helicase domain-containing protein
VRKAVFREVNFGHQDFFDGDSIEIAGNKVSRQGFLLCEKCGKVMPERKPEQFKHAIDCVHYGKSLEKGMLNCLYMYRQFESEAIRILLPIAEVEISSRMPSFIAALYMGLAEKFRGSVGHLQLMITDEPVPDSMLRKKYLVLYDQVPGGTGYLKELMKTPEDIMGLLQLAFDKLKGCACQADATKDGCYQCLYAYRVSRDLPNISRTEAMSLLEEILRHRDNLEEISTLDDIQVNALFESELEARFIEALRRSSTPDCRVELRSDVVHGKPGYFMLVNGVGYQIEPQVELGERQGVSVSSRADFVIYPVREGLPIAIFTDGFSYHADMDGGNYRLPLDLEQRMALMRSGRYICWSLSYEDVMSRFDDSIREYWAPFHPGNIDHLLRAYEGQHAIRPIKSAIRKSPLEGLLLFLAQPDRSAWPLLAYLCSLSFGKMGQCSAKEAESAAAGFMLDAGNPFELIEQLEGGPIGEGFFWSGRIVEGTPQVRHAAILSYGPAVRIRANDFQSLRCIVRLDDAGPADRSSGFKRAWNGLLQLMNVIQFLPGAQFVSTQFLADGYSVPERSGAPADFTADKRTGLYQNLRELVIDETALTVLAFSFELGMPVPVPGFEICDDDGRVLGEAELAWPEQRLAALLDGDSPDPFEEAGWTCLFLSRIANKEILFETFQKAESAI